MLQILRIKLKWAPRLLIRTVVVFKKKKRNSKKLQQTALLAGVTPGCTGVLVPAWCFRTLWTHSGCAHTTALRPEGILSLWSCHVPRDLIYLWNLKWRFIKSTPPTTGEGGLTWWGSSQSFGFSDNRVESKTWELISLFILGCAVQEARDHFDMRSYLSKATTGLK